MTGPDGQTEWNPQLFADHSHRISFHEAAHCVADYLLNQWIMSAEIRERDGVVKVVRSKDPIKAAVCSLAGVAFESSIDLEPSGSDDDATSAEQVLAARYSGRQLDEACRVAQEAAFELVRSERFQTLVHALAPKLRKERYMSGSNIRELLEEADPELAALRRQRPTNGQRGGRERHSAGNIPKVPWVDHPRGRNHHPSCVVCLAYPSGPP